MRNQRRIWTAILVLAVACVVAWQILPSRDSEPVYKGKRLSEWLSAAINSFHPDTLAYNPPNPSEIQADEAVRHIGTNAIPTLLEMIQETDSPLKLKWIALMRKQHFFKPPQEAFNRNLQAIYAFKTLGSTASNAVPDLVRIYRGNLSPDSQVFILAALGRIGPPAAPKTTPILLDGLTNGDLRMTALYVIGEIHGQPEVFVPALINALKDSDPSVRATAITALGNYGPTAEPAVPALAGLLNDADPDISTEATNALKAIDPVAATKAGVK